MSDQPSDFQSKLLTNICQGMHTMLTDKVLCDLQVTVGSQMFDCHLLLLASVSGFFRSLTSSSCPENSVQKVTIEDEDVTNESFQMFLDILYKSEDVITVDTAAEILKMSLALRVKFLELHCIDYLITNLTPEVCIGLWMLAEKHHLPTLADKTLAMASDQIDQVVKSEEILQLPEPMFLMVLGAQRKLSMDDICRIILRWVEADPDARQVCFGELLPFVSFPQLSPGYVHELMGYFHHPFFKHISEKIREAVSFNLQDQTPDLKRQILAKQERIASSSLLQTCAVILSGRDEADDVATQHPVSAFCVEPGTKFYSFILKAPPEPFEPQSVSCTYRNELYVSRGSEEKTLLTKYVPGNNEWEILPHLESGVENHAMAAVLDKIYLIGGSAVDEKKTSHGITCYAVNTKTWTRQLNGLQVNVQEPATAVIGHKIYVFGGKDDLKNPVDTVQCVDTRSGQVHLAGCLPTTTEQVAAFSDGGTIYVLCDGTQVLKMKERLQLSEKKGSCANAKGNNGGVPPDPLPQTRGSSPCVSFLDVGSFTGGKVLSAFLHEGELVGCRTLTSDGILSSDVQAMNLATAEVAKKRLAFEKSAKDLGLHTLNIPREFLDEEMALGRFQPDDRVKWKKSVPPPTVYSINYNQYQYQYEDQYHTSTQLSCDYIGTVQSVDANGTVTTGFPNYRPHSSPASSLRFA